MNTTAISVAVTPTVVSTFFSHYLKRGPLRQKPTAHLSYDEGLRLIRSFLEYASEHAVEELQAFTSQWVPHPTWVKVEEAVISQQLLTRAAGLLNDQLGPEGVRQVGGSKWWQWRKPGSSGAELKAEWIEMRADYHERKRKADPGSRSSSGNRIMLYVHGGAYFFGSVDEHRYQMQRHARKLKARVFAPRYRLAPQFPFPCGLQDCLAAYLFLLDSFDPKTIILAGDSAGGGMVLSVLVTLRDRGLPLPAGAILISPWVDLTHSFPSVAEDCPLDYLPEGGFHHRPSEVWPPPDEQELEQMKNLVMEQKTKNNEGNNEKSTQEEAKDAPTTEDIAQKTQHLSLMIDGEKVEITEQIQMYTTNELLRHPLVSPVMQPTLGGLPPLLFTVGGGEALRDEQLYIAHKCANPRQYAPPEWSMDADARAQLDRYEPTDVQLQLWEDLCHVTPTLSFTRPAKYMFRSVAQFGAWALAKAQGADVDILADDHISVISRSESSDSDRADDKSPPRQTSGDAPARAKTFVGTASDPLPPFTEHMIRQRVTRHGEILPLEPPESLPGCSMDRELVGVIKVGPVKKWLDRKQLWASRYHKYKTRAQKKLLRDMMVGFESFGDGEFPPPSALAGRRKIGVDPAEVIRGKRRRRSIGLAIWSLWGSKHDEMTVEREERAEKAEKEPDVRKATPAEGQSVESTTSQPKGQEEPTLTRGENGRAEAGGYAGDNGASPVPQILSHDPTGSSTPAAEPSTPSIAIDTGVTGKRPTIDGIAVPFSLGKEADTASMLTLNSGTRSGPVTPRPMSPPTRKSGDRLEAGSARHMPVENAENRSSVAISP